MAIIVILSMIAPLNHRFISPSENLAFRGVVDKYYSFAAFATGRLPLLRVAINRLLMWRSATGHYLPREAAFLFRRNA